MNHWELDAVLEEVDVVRYSLSGVPILECKVHHKGLATEAGWDRKVDFLVDCISIGETAISLQKESLGTLIKAQGFLTVRSVRSNKLVLHITEYVKGV